MLVVDSPPKRAWARSIQEAPECWAAADGTGGDDSFDVVPEAGWEGYCADDESSADHCSLEGEIDGGETMPDLVEME